jgi:predicted ribosome quality control (RQC) complex YloA/Tae2 family protein
VSFFFLHTCQYTTHSSNHLFIKKVDKVFQFKKDGEFWHLESAFFHTQLSLYLSQIGIAEQHQQQRIAELEQLLERITARLEAYHKQLIAVLEAQNKQLIAVLEAQNKQRIVAEARNEQHFTILKDHLHILQAAFAKERTCSITPILAK